MKARLTGSREIGLNTLQLDFETEGGELAFLPGQFVSLTREIAGNPVTRAYSIASPPGTAGFSLCANLVPDGRFSPFLFGMSPGDEVDFKGPYGTFVLRKPPSDSIFVATGTGIAPFRSMLHASLHGHPESRFTLIFGVRHKEGLLYHDELRGLARDHANFDYRPTLTRPDENWHGLTGRVQQHTLHTLGTRRDMDVYICGLREMVDDLRTRLRDAGLDRKRIVYEKYD